MKVMLKIFLIVLSIIPLQSWAMKNEPMGFKDLYMHKDFRQVLIGDRKIEYYADRSNQIYSSYYIFLNPNEEASYLGIPLLDGVPLMTDFYQENLRMIDISFIGESMVKKLYGVMVKEYGLPDEYEAGAWYWTGNHVYVVLKEIDNVGTISFCSVRIIDKEFALELAKRNRFYMRMKSGG